MLKAQAIKQVISLSVKKDFRRTHPSTYLGLGVLVGVKLLISVHIAVNVKITNEAADLVVIAVVDRVKAGAKG